MISPSISPYLDHGKKGSETGPPRSWLHVHTAALDRGAIHPFAKEGCNNYRRQSQLTIGMILLLLSSLRHSTSSGSTSVNELNRSCDRCCKNEFRSDANLPTKQFKTEGDFMRPIADIFAEGFRPQRAHNTQRASGQLVGTSLENERCAIPVSSLCNTEKVMAS